MPKRSNEVNVDEVMIKGQKYYRARLTFPFDEELGRRPSPKAFYGKTVREAVAKRDRYEPERDQLDTKTLFLAFMRDQFLPEQEEKARRQDMTWQYFQNRKRRLERFFIDPESNSLNDLKIRHVVLSNLKPVHIEDYFKSLTKLRVKPEYISRLRDDLKVALRSIKRHIPERVEDYFEDVDVPTLPKRIKPLVVFDADEVFRVIRDKTKPIEDRALVAFPFIMQCRPSEMYALQWLDLDLESGTVTFHKAMRKQPIGFAVSDGTKTGEKGVRTAAMGSFLTGLLREVQKQRMSHSKASKWVFVTETGLPIHKDRMDRLWARMKRNLGLPNGPTFYSLKHLGNSYALAHGITAEAQAEKMGHSTPRMATQVYREILTEEKQQVVSIFDSKLIDKVN